MNLAALALIEVIPFGAWVKNDIFFVFSTASGPSWLGHLR